MSEDVLLITVDSLRADHVGAYGYDRETTPFLDELSAGGHTFTRAFAHAGATRFSFPSILAGSTAHMFGGFETMSTERTLIAEVMRGAGYQTAGFHSNPFLSTEFGYSRGFDTFYDARSDPSASARLRQYVRSRLDTSGTVFSVLKSLFDAVEREAGVEIGSAYERADDITDRAIGWLEGADEDTPLFLWIHYMDVHHPYVPPAEYQEHFRADSIGERRAVQLRRLMLESPGDVTESEHDDIVDLYDAEIRFTDVQVARLVEAMRAERIDEPAILFTSDHGEEFGEHGQFSHNTLHDEGIHVPLVVSDGGEGVYDEIVGLLDLCPTIARYADQSIPESFYGYPLQRLMKGDRWEREAVIGEGGYRGESNAYYFYRDDHWKYLLLDGGGTRELYDLERDPGEREDVVDDEPEVVERIEDAIDAHQAEIDATQQDLGTIEVDEEIRERLEMLGYKE